MYLQLETAAVHNNELQARGNERIIIFFYLWYTYQSNTLL